MPINLDDIKQCYYIPGKPGIIDYVHPHTGLGAYSKKTLEQIREEDPGAELGDFAAVCAQQDDFWRSPPVEITHERWDEMLGVLPPVGWESGPDDSEVFKLSERTAGAITAIFCRLGERYYEMQDEIFLSTTEVIAKVQTFVREGK